ncbi:MAG: iduronate-2-sulfatase [Pirellulaceae bacterium]|nr:MAG: iduronate-2-sulfatase [Pirellulaceae bacterium]
MQGKSLVRAALVAIGWAIVVPTAGAAPGDSAPRAGKYNVLLILSDDLTSTALSCYGSRFCSTPHIDALAQQSVRFTRAYCQGTYCGPSRASFLSGYYPHALGILNYVSPRPVLEDRATWPQHFRLAGYTTARVSKVFHMGVPGGIEEGDDGADDPLSWDMRFNSQGPEWKAPGKGETLEGNPDGRYPGPVGGNTFVVVEADEAAENHADGKTTRKACALIDELQDSRFFLAVGFVRPHVPFVAPKQYFTPFPWRSMELPPKIPGDWDDIPPTGINYKTTLNMQMNLDQQRKAKAAYCAAVAFVDAQVGRILAALDDAGLSDETIVIFTSDHGYHLGEHDFWAKVSLHEESAAVPLLIRVPGQSPAVSDSLVELLDLFPTTASLCGLPVPERLQGKDITAILDVPTAQVRDAAFCVNGKGFLLRTERFAFMQYGEDGRGGWELYDMLSDPFQFHNLARLPEFEPVVAQFKQKLQQKLASIRSNDLRQQRERSIP